MAENIRNQLEEDCAEKQISIKEFVDLLCVTRESKLVKPSGSTAGVATLWSDSKLLLVNSDNFEKEFVLEEGVTTIRDCYSNKPVNFKNNNGHTFFTLSPYGVFFVEGLN